MSYILYKQNSRTLGGSRLNFDSLDDAITEAFKTVTTLNCAERVMLISPDGYVYHLVREKGTRFVWETKTLLYQPEPIRCTLYGPGGLLGEVRRSEEQYYASVFEKGGHKCLGWVDSLDDARRLVVEYWRGWKVIP